MSATRFSRAKDGQTGVAPHFKVLEFACRDGSDEILLDLALPPVLEDIRTRCGGHPLVVNSGYRTASYNARVGGAKDSYHMKGMAADVSTAGAGPSVVAEKAELALFSAGIPGGIALYTSFVHVDVRPVPWRGNMVTGKTISGFGPAALPTLRRGSASPDVKTLQSMLNLKGACLAVDGVFGPLTEEAVRVFQTEYQLSADGVAGRQTWCALHR